MEKEPLLGKTLKELEAIVVQNNLQIFVAKQIADWLYKKNISSISEMTNLSVKVRNRLEEIYEIGKLPPIKGQVSVDGTIKYLYPTYKGKFIETAFIPEKGRATLCVSSQIGCRMGCFFCMTAKQGLNGQLSAGEIINQLISLPEHNRITNIVYMGMGEPFDNIDEVMKSLEILTSTYGFGFGPKRITVSTIGVIPGIKQFLYESKCHLAVSLHSPFDEERQKLMPIQKIYPIKEVLNEIKKFNFGLQRRISFEYIMFKNLNDSPGHVKELTRILNGIRCRINLIKYHTIPGSRFEPSENESIIIFKDALNNKGIKTTLRQSRGQDIYAACGLLSTKLDYSG